MSYYFSRRLDMPFDEAIAHVTGELKKEGFGVLTEIDVKATLKKKLGEDFRNYRILGTCNPPFAHQALCCPATSSSRRQPRVQWRWPLSTPSPPCRPLRIQH
jgi:hypothetical protein